MSEIFRVTFFGHRNFCQSDKYEEQVQKLLREIVSTHEYVEFLVGNNGGFDSFISGQIRKMKKDFSAKNYSHILVLPYINNSASNSEYDFERLYDETEVSNRTIGVYSKYAIPERNKDMIERCDLAIFYVVAHFGGAYKAYIHALKKEKIIINLAEVTNGL